MRPQKANATLETIVNHLLQVLHTHLLEGEYDADEFTDFWGSKETPITVTARLANIINKLPATASTPPEPHTEKPLISHETDSAILANRSEHSDAIRLHPQRPDRLFDE